MMSLKNGLASVLASGVAMGALSAGVILAPTAVHAQVITGAINGRLTDDGGKPLAGVVVTVLHVPSGTKSVVTTSADGVFAARNLRPGGPYAVTADSPTLGSKTVQVASINTGDAFQLNFTLSSTQGEESEAVDELIVTAASVGARDLKTGPSTNFSAVQIMAAPSIARDLKDLVRANPFVTVDPTNSNALVCGGSNNRSNSLTIDGVRQNDDFGLQVNGYPTQRSPISLDVVETLGVELAPYDVNYGQFGGCTLNATTKSGGNAFHGIAFFEETNQHLQGKNFSYTDFQNGSQQTRKLGGKFSEKTYGLTVSGPIIKNYLFFTLNYEKFEHLEPSLVGPTGSGLPNEVPGITVAQADQVRSIIQSVYGYDPLGYSTAQLPATDQKIFAKLDWNINNRQRATVSFQQTYDYQLQSTNNTLAGTSPSLSLLSQWNNKANELDVYKVQLFSSWTDNLSTELSASYKKMDAPPTPLVGTDLAQFRVFLNGTASGPSIYAGTNANNQANEITTYLQQYRAKATYTIGEHKITAGLEREYLRIYDLFVQNAEGSYVFNSIADLQNRLASQLTYANAGVSNNKVDGGAVIHTATNTAYLQDEWSILPNLTLKGGVRFDYYEQSDKPVLNNNFVARYGFPNNGNIGGTYILQPRFGFNWQPDSSTVVYGGVGLFGGGSPTVWTANTFYNTGVQIGNVNCARSPTTSAACLAGLNNVDAMNVAAAIQALNTANAAQGAGITNSLDPNFKPQSSWKTSIGIQRSFDLGHWGGDNWRATAEFIHSEVKDAITWVDLYAAANPGLPAPDGRPTFSRNRPLNTYDIYVTNTDKGYTNQVAVSLSKFWMNGLLDGLDANVSHTYIDAKDINPGVSTVAAANYRGVATDDPNNPSLATSNYEFTHLTKLSVNYDRKFFGDNHTRFSLFAQRRSGAPFSYTFDVAANASQAADNLIGENGANGAGNRDLLYVPAMTGGVVTSTSDPIVRYAAGFDLAGFNNFLARTGLSEYAGGIAPRNSFKSPEVSTIDLRISQEVPVFLLSEAKAEVYFDVINLGNLLNKKWGVIQQIPSPYLSANVIARNCQFTGVCASGVGNYYQYDSFNGKSATSFNAQSVWQMKAGARFKF